MKNQLDLFQLEESLAPTSFKLCLREYLPKFSDFHDCIVWLYERMGPKERTYVKLLKMLDREGQDAYDLAEQIGKSYSLTLLRLRELERMAWATHINFYSGCAGRPPKLWQSRPIP